MSFIEVMDLIAMIIGYGVMVGGIGTIVFILLVTVVKEDDDVYIE